MHEMSLAMGLIREVQRQLEPYGPGATATRVVLDVGAMHAVVPEAMQLAFEVAGRGTVAEGAELEIRQIPVRGRCPTCDRDWVLEQVYFLCPSCGGPVSVVAGRELTLATIEFEDPADSGDAEETE